MAFSTLMILVVMGVYFIKNKQNRIPVYEAREGLGESYDVFIMLKQNNLKPNYSVPIDWLAAFYLGKGQSTAVISVHKKDIKKARELVMFYRADQRRVKHERPFI